jgi:hypothetical protein
MNEWIFFFLCTNLEDSFTVSKISRSSRRDSDLDSDSDWFRFIHSFRFFDDWLIDSIEYTVHCTVQYIYYSIVYSSVSNKGALFNDFCPCLFPSKLRFDTLLYCTVLCKHTLLLASSGDLKKLNFNNVHDWPNIRPYVRTYTVTLQYSTSKYYCMTYCTVTCTSSSWYSTVVASSSHHIHCNINRSLFS